LWPHLILPQPLDAMAPGYQAPLPASAARLGAAEEAALLEEDEEGRPARHRTRRVLRGRRAGGAVPAFYLNACVHALVHAYMCACVHVCVCVCVSVCVCVRA
jgi:hypothetical protein